MKTNDVSLAVSFFENLEYVSKNNPNGYEFKSIYKIILKTFITLENFDSVLSVYLGEYKKDKDPNNWFTSFHKSIRQVGFSDDNITAKRITNILTEDQIKRRKELLSLRSQLRKTVDEDLSKFSTEQKDEYKSYGLELDEINKVAYSAEHISLTGNMDSLLYLTISLDCSTDNIIQKTMERTFKLAD